MRVGRIWLLERLGDDLDVFVGVEIALMRETIPLPGPHDHLEGLEEPPPALGIGHVVALVILGQSAAAYAEVEAPFADVVHGGCFLGDAQGVGQG